MRIKKGFTLAEILIVLMVIGVIATMTIPSLMKGVNEAQFKTAFKKAFNAVSNIAAVEKIGGQLPVKASTTSVYNFFASLNANLSVKEYSTAWSAISATTAQDVIDAGSTYSAVTLNSTKYGSTTATATNTLSGGTVSAGTPTPWIITEDGLAYSVFYVNGATCETKLSITEETSAKNAAKASCVVVLVDVNGLAKGPNKLEAQVNDGISSNVKLNTLEGDRYYIFVGSDGVTAGPKAYTVSGRIMSDLK